MERAVIVSAKRTPVGGFLGGLSSLRASDLGGVAIRGVLESAGMSGGEVDDVIMGQVLSAGQGQNPARQAAHEGGIPFEKTAMLINQLCGSGLRTVAMAKQALESGDAGVVIAGGQESMSRSPHTLHLRSPTKMGNGVMTDSMVSDGLSDAFYGYHMGVTAENIAKKWQITREDQDAFACSSQNKAERAMEEGKFSDEVVSVRVKGRRGETVVSEDEHPRKGTTVESLGAMRPAFDKEGTVTAGNASGINDGAAVVLMMRESEAERRGLEPLARVVAWASEGVDPSLMGTGPIPSTRKVLEKSGWKAEDVDLIESNEAFAAQALSVMRELNFDPSKVNVNGGAIALGHPIGASGTRILVTLLHEMLRRDVKRGLATMCIGGGMGIALTVER